MGTGITRRDFMNGIAIAVLGSTGVDLSRADGPAPRRWPVTGRWPVTVDGPAAPYPPARDGLRGSHVGSFEAAHRLRDGGAFDLSRATVEERYDLVVVGAGISGLAAAHFYRQKHPAGPRSHPGHQ